MFRRKFFNLESRIKKLWSKRKSLFGIKAEMLRSFIVIKKLWSKRKYLFVKASKNKWNWERRKGIRGARRRFWYLFACTRGLILAPASPSNFTHFEQYIRIPGACQYRKQSFVCLFFRLFSCAEKMQVFTTCSIFIHATKHFFCSRIDCTNSSRNWFVSYENAWFMRFDGIPAKFATCEQIHCAENYILHTVCIDRVASQGNQVYNFC